MNEPNNESNRITDVQNVHTAEQVDTILTQLAQELRNYISSVNVYSGTYAGDGSIFIEDEWYDKGFALADKLETALAAKDKPPKERESE